MSYYYLSIWLIIKIVSLVSSDKTLKMLKCAFIASLFGIALSIDDPCTSATRLPSLWKRFSGMTLPEGDSFVCDYYLTEGWYSMYDYYISGSSESCGTSFSWYRTDTLPEEGTKELSLCASYEENKCIDERSIDAKICDDGTYVFYLTPLDSCPEAYCIETKTGEIPEDDGTQLDVSSIDPVVIADTEWVNEEKINYLYFYCDFDPLDDSKYLYFVVWSETEDNVWITELHAPEPAKFNTLEEFRRNTRLTHKHLDAKAKRLNIKIACSVTARRYIFSVDSDTRLSEEQFFGIEMINSKSLTIEYDPEKDIGDPVYVSFKLSVPFGGRFGSAKDDPNQFYFYLNMKHIDSNGQCKISDLVTAQNKHVLRNCGSRLTLNDYQNGNVEKTELKLRKGDGLLSWNHKFFIFFQTQTLPFDPYLSELNMPLISVTVKQRLGVMAGKYCYSHNDPHMRTFDGRRYDNHVPGTHILYRNNRDNAQMKTAKCGGASCNCGIAVNVGRDVFVINACTYRIRFDIKFKQCDDGLLRDKVTKSGNTYKVYFPSGAEVHISLWSPPWMNIQIKPSVQDFNNVEGMCGSFDNNPNNDRGTGWGVTDGLDDLFVESNLRTYPWPGEQLFCECIYPDPDNQPLDPLDYIVCSVDEAKKCDLSRDESVFNLCYPRSEGLISRKRRETLTVGGDVHESSDTSYRAPAEDDAGQAIVDFSPEEALAYCQEAFDIPVMHICDQIPNFNVTNAIYDCVSDIESTNTTEWTLANIGAITSLCEMWISDNTPPPIEFLNNVTLIINGEEYDNLTEDLLSGIINPVFTTSTLQSVQNLYCPNQCLKRGDCVNGTCQCNEMYTGIDCSINLQKPPKMLGIPDNGKCDRVQRLCELTSVYVSNIAENCSCVKTSLKVSNNGTITEGETQTVQANKLSPTEVQCSLPTSSRRKRQTDEDTPNDIIAEGFNISITNDGYETSEGDIIIIYDSECVNCSSVDGEIECHTLLDTGLCVNNGLCYEQNSSVGCYECLEVNGVASWINMCDMDDCSSDPCQNEATCVDGQSSYTCSCAPGWEGTHCDQELKRCASSPCQNEATCVDDQSTYTCACAPGWEGTHCDQELNSCASSPCQNEATCVDGQSSYTCSCAQGWEGTHCEEELDRCASSPCQNEATCVDGQSSYTCSCAPGWEGTHCDQDTNECLSYPCKNGATCSDLFNAYECKCTNGYVGRNCDANTLPTSGSKELQVCMTGQNMTACEETDTVTAAKCPDGNYTFFLSDLAACPEAYCIEPLDENTDTSLACVSYPSGTFGGFCHDDVPCSFDHSTCLLYKCECSSGYYYNVDRCLQDGEVGGKCFADGSCNAEAICSGYFCECGEGTTQVDDSCLAHGLTGASCLDNEVCEDENAFCQKSEQCQDQRCTSTCLQKTIPTMETT
ncbi:FBP1-like protein [Mya arenaria]|uniref:FBP1-like protein n=1 Tax=Mya arenaria TaxID=6604 RepID=A0ABY7DK65_MYAAR|nr:FBP1-like protein [Mya arenaria]